MPELPEVKTITTDLNKIVLNKKITNVSSLVLKSLEFNISNKDINILTNQKIKNIYQFGKNIIFLLSDYKVVIHLRMEGKFTYLKNDKNQDFKFPIIIFEFSDKSKLVLTDHRKFATVKIYDKSLEDNIIFNKNGPEPWNVNINTIFEKSKRSRTPIKSFLLNQQNISGLGNIYVDEVLYESKIHPEQKSNTLNKKDIELIINNSISILKNAIEHRGSTISTYSSLGIKGTYQNELKVHTRENQKCSCGSTIEKIKVGGRGTYFCPKEQQIREVK